MVRNLTLYSLAMLLLSAFFSCSSVKEIGKINMVSQRNVDSKNAYVLIKTYAGSGKEVKRGRAKTLEDAVDQTVRNVPGGEFLKNVKFYRVNKKYYAVEGDVWGQTQGDFKGFHIGDKVQWSSITGVHNGIIKGFVNDQRCMVQEDKKTSSSEEQFDKLKKVSE